MLNGLIDSRPRRDHCGRCRFMRCW